MLESKRILYGRRDSAKEKKGRENEALFFGPKWRLNDRRQLQNSNPSPVQFH
jgi:hypothetical protein